VGERERVKEKRENCGLFIIYFLQKSTGTTVNLKEVGQRKGESEEKGNIDRSDEKRHR